jgi:predicted bacteriocin transport accessory protein
MRKSDIVLIGVVILVIAVAILFGKSTDTQGELNIEYPVTLAGKVGLNEVTYSEYAKMVDAGDPFVVVIERAGCYYCQMYMPILKEYVEKHKIAVTYIDTDNLTEEEARLLSTKNKYLRNNEWGTPTTLFMVGKEVVDTIGGYVEESSIDAFFKDKVVMGE